MKTFLAKAGPFAEQPFYERCEIELTCTDELRRLDLYPEPGVKPHTSPGCLMDRDGNCVDEQ